jgi:hypothetical protein
VRIDDPTLLNNDRSTSLSALIYTPSEGAYFDGGYVEIEYKYSDKDYIDFMAASAQKYTYSFAEEDLNFLYYDSKEEGYFTYANVTLRDINQNIIKIKTKRFFDGEVKTDSSCSSQDNFFYESYDRRVILGFTNGTKLMDSSRNCLKDLRIKISQKGSNVVNFGEYDYDLLPSGAVFEPYITYTYRYTESQINSPKFLYGYYNWEDLINDTWQDPTQSLITGKIILDGSLKQRLPTDLNIAYYEASSGIYRPVKTNTDLEKKTVTGKISHFSKWINAMGCEDKKFMKRELIEQVANHPDEGTCTSSNPNNPAIKEISFEIKKDNTCTTEQGFFPTTVPSTGDTAELTVFDSSCTGSCPLTIKLTDADLKEVNSNYCAEADLYIKIQGIGFKGPDGWKAGSLFSYLTEEEYLNQTTAYLGNCTLSNNFCCDESLDVL